MSVIGSMSRKTISTFTMLLLIVTSFAGILLVAGASPARADTNGGGTGTGGGIHPPGRVCGVSGLCPHR